MNSSENPATEIKKKKNTTLWVMVVLFGLPYIAAFYFYFNRADMDLMTSNYGTIISPAHPIPDVKLQKLDNSDFKISSLKGKWVLMSIGSSECKQDCIENLYKIRQIKKAVGPNFDRITKLVFLKDKTNIESFKLLLKEYYGMDVIVPSGSNYNNFLMNFLYEGVELEDSIFIIDPAGNYMMAYPKGADAKKMLKDIERLLKVSKIG